MNHIQKVAIIIATSCLMILIALHNPFSGYKYIGHYDYDNIPTKENLINVVKIKYPYYKEFSDSLLFEKLAEKHPEYLKQIKNNRKTPILIGGKVSKKAVFSFIDEKSELIGYTIPIIIYLVIWLLLFKTNKNAN